MTEEMELYPRPEGRREDWAHREVNLLYAAAGLQMERPVTKIINPNQMDMANLLKNVGGSSGIKGRIEEKILMKAGGMVDPVTETVYVLKGKEYMPGIFGIDWSGALEGVSDTSVHETAHVWMLQHCDDGLKRIIGRLGVPIEAGVEVGESREKQVCAKILSEGIATYIAKRCNDYIRNTMVTAVEKSFPGDTQKRERCATDYGRFVDVESIDATHIEEDWAMTAETMALIYARNPLTRIRKQEQVRYVTDEVFYRLGYNMVDRFVGKKREEGLSEADALKLLINDWPDSISKVGRVLGIIEDEK